MYLTDFGFSSSHIIDSEPKTYKSENFEITFEIINPILLDSLFYHELRKNGKFNYKYYNSSSKTFFEKRKSKKANNEYETVIDGLTVLLAQKKISQIEYNVLLNQINAHYQTNTEKIGIPTDPNPFYINGKYLSVIKTIIRNNANTDITLNKSDISIYSGTQKFHPLSNEQIINMHTLDNTFNNEVYENLLKFNLPQKLSIPQTSKITKYIVTFPFIEENDKIFLNYKNSHFEWNNEIESQEFNNTLKFYAFNVNPRIENDNLMEIQHFYIVRDSKGGSFVDNNRDKVYTTLESRFKILSYTIYNDKLYFGSTTYINPLDYIDLEKKKRKKIYIDYSRFRTE
jgi:hypothetical protein